MKRLAGPIALFVFAAAPLPLMAYPDGAPWGSADPEGAQNCASCHFDNEAVPDSAAISLSFEDKVISPGEPLDIHVQLRNPHNNKAGFQIISSVGTFTSAYEDIEVNGRQARSIAPRDNASWPEMLGVDFSTNATVWKLQWIPPESPGEDVYFWIAVNESNDDQSAFGDRIHFKTVKASVAGDFRLLPALR